MYALVAVKMSSATGALDNVTVVNLETAVGSHSVDDNVESVVSFAASGSSNSQARGRVALKVNAFLLKTLNTAKDSQG